MAKQTILKRLLNGLKTRFMGLLLPVLALFTFLFLALPSGAFGAFSDYINITDATFSSSSISVYWDKAGGIGNNSGIILTIGTSSIASPLYYDFHLGEQSWFLNNFAITGAKDTPSGCAIGADYYSSASSTGNVSNLGYIIDENGNATTTNNIPPGSAIYAVAVNWDYGETQCQQGAFHYLDSEYLGAFSTENINIISPTEYASTDTNGWPLGWIIQNDVPSSTNTGVVIWPTLAPTQTQSAEIAETGLVYLPDTFTYIPNYYQGYAYAKAGSTILATSTIRNFSIYIPEDITTSTAYSACDAEDSSWFGRAFCRSMVFLFAPHKPVLENFTRLSTRADKVMPFSIFADIRDAMTISATTTDQLISSSTLSAFSIFTTFRTGLGVVLWLIFAFWAIRALRHIQH